MAFSERCVTSLAPSPLAANGPRPRRRASVVGALALALGCAICAPAVLAQSTPALSGKWQLSCMGRGGDVRQISLDIEQQGATLSGSYSGGRRSGQLSGSVQGNQVSFELAGKRRSASFTGTTDGNALQVHSAKGGVSCTATRQ
jgi:hypothetical protein